MKDDIQCERGLAPYGGSKRPPRLCSVCGAPHYCKGYCQLHYERARKHGGDPMKVIPVRERRHIRLNEALVMEARLAREGGATVVELAKYFGVNRSTLSKAVNGQNWRDCGAA